MSEESKFENYIVTRVIKARIAFKNGIKGYEVAYPAFQKGADNVFSWCPVDVFKSIYRKITSEELELIEDT